MDKRFAVFIELVRKGIGHRADLIFDEIDWNDIQALAERHGLSAIVVDAVERLPENQRPPKPVLLQWIGETLQGYEYRYELYRRTIAEMAVFFNLHGYKMMVLKGYACSIDWPNPEHRPCGDIDIWQFGQQKEADDLLVKEKGIKVDNSHHHHSVFFWRDFMVENHYDFVNIHYGHKNKELETILKDLAQDDSNLGEIDGHTVYLPSANLHALFLLRHCMHDFASAEMNLRQLLDWAFFIEKHTNEIDWKWFIEILKSYKMMDFFNCLNAICVGDLGFDVNIFPKVQFDPFVKERVLNEILEPSYVREEPRELVSRLIYKYRRWKGNAWKQELCYHDSRTSSFFTGVWNHILKPKTI